MTDGESTPRPLPGRAQEGDAVPGVGSAAPDAVARRVLVVDDEATIRIALRRFFTRLGWQVEEAANGAGALSMIEHDATQQDSARFSLVVSDLRMPGLNGIELYERLRSSHPDVLRRLVFSTGDIVSEEAATFVNSTDCIVLQKPFELSLLRETIERVLATADQED